MNPSITHALQLPETDNTYQLQCLLKQHAAVGDILIGVAKLLQDRDAGVVIPHGAIRAASVTAREKIAALRAGRN